MMTKHIFAVFLMAILIVPFTACNKNNDRGPEADLAGTWTMQQSETTVKLSEDTEETVARDYDSETNPSTVTFTADGQIHTKDWDEEAETYTEISGSYTIIEGKIHASIAEDVFSFDNGLNYAITGGNTLTISGRDIVLIDILDVEAEVFVTMTLRR